MLLQMEPRDVLHTEVDAQCDNLHGQACRSNIDRRKYCQLSSTDDCDDWRPSDDGLVYRTERPPLSSKADNTMPRSTSLEQFFIQSAARLY